jgi:PAS domain S-box-containing protein
MPLRDAELRKEFLKETRGNIKELNLCINKLNQKPNDQDIKKIALRLTHSLEGDSLLAKRFDIAYFASKTTRLIDSGEMNYAKSLIKSMEKALKEIKELKGNKESTEIINKLKEIEEIKRESDEELKKSEENFKSLVSNIPGTIYKRINDKYQTTQYLSSNIVNLSGYSPKFLLENAKRSFISIVHPDDQKLILKTLKDRCGMGFEIEYRIITKKGSTIWVKDRGVCRYVKSIKKCVIEGSIFDITKEKEYEERMALQSEITKNLSEGVYLIGLNDGKIKYTNNTFSTMFGYKPGEMVGKNVSIVNAPTKGVDAKKRVEKITKELLKNKEWQGEVLNIKKDGTPFWCYANVSIFKHPTFGEVMVSVHTDITERKKSAIKLEESEEKFKSIFNNVTVGILGADPKTQKFTITNKKICEMLGYNPEELLKMKVSNIHPKKDLARVKEAFKKQMERKGRVAEALPVLRKDKKVIYCDISSTPQKIMEQDVLLGIFQDVTSRKKIEENFKILFDKGADAIFIHDKEGKFIEVNEKACKSLGYTREELLRYKVFKIEVGLKKKNLDELWKTIGKKTLSLKGAHRKKDGSKFAVEINLHKIQYNGKEVFMATSRAMDDKKYEENLSKTIMDTLPYGFDIVDENMKIVYLNKLFLKLFGEKSIGKKCYQVYKDNKKQCPNCPLKKKIKIGETKTIVTSGVAGGKTFKITHTGIKLPEGNKGVLEFFEEVKK